MSVSLMFGGAAVGAAIVAGLFKIIEILVNHFFTKGDKKKADMDERLKRVESKQDDFAVALRQFMRDRILFLCKRYISQGYIEEDDYEALIALHQAYHNQLGGNGTLNAIMAKVDALPIK